MTVKEQEKIVKAAPGFVGGQIVILLLYTGLRVGEAAALTWDDIDLENRCLTVNKTQGRHAIENGKYVYHLYSGSPKTKTSIRRVPLIRQLVEMLEELKAENEEKKQLLGEYYNPGNHVFCTSNGRMVATTEVAKKVKRIANRAGVKDVHPHSLRHTFATRGAEQGIDMKVMQTLLGHSDIKMTANVYTHVMEEQKALNITKLEALLETEKDDL